MPSLARSQRDTAIRRVFIQIKPLRPVGYMQPVFGGPSWPSRSQGRFFFQVIVLASSVVSM
jgi:hypothetical protein